MTFQEHGIYPKRDHGQTKTTCPQCSEGRKKPKDPCLSINVDEGTWYCHNCGWKGGLKKHTHTPASSTPRPTVKPQAPETALPSKVIDWFAGRGIPSEVLKRNSIGYEKVFIPGAGKEVMAIAFPYYRNGELVNVKHRDGEKHFRQTSGAEKILYGLDDIKADWIIIVEGEMDKLSFEVAGFENCLSVPDGAPSPEAKNYDNKFSYLANCEAHLKPLKRIIIAVDSDAPGRKLEAELIRRLGPERCWRVTWVPGCKDANEVLVKHGIQALSDCISTASPVPIAGLLTEDGHEMPKGSIIKPWPPSQTLAPFAGIIPLNTVKPETVSYLWQGHIALGKLCVFDGDPGLGKSTLTVDLAARVSTGAPMPDGTPGIKGGVAIISGEDGLADTIVPRLEAHGADLSRIVALQGVPDDTRQLRPPTIEDIAAIRTAIEEVSARLLIIDPLMAHLPGAVNSFRDQDIRRVLTPLASMAEDTGVAVILVRHLNKGAGSQAIYRGGGSIGIIGAARTAFIIAKDPEDEDKRIFAPIKNNIAKMPPSLSFTLQGTDSGVARIAWGGVSEHGADALLAVPSSAEEVSALEEAKEFLSDTLAEGAVEAQKIKRDARDYGIADRTLKRAKKILNIEAKKDGFKQGWSWELPEGGQETPKGAKENDDTLREKMDTFAGKEISRPGIVTVQEVIEYGL